MATGRGGRQDRLNQRLRGAQRTNVGDDISFTFDLAGVPPAQSSSSPAVVAQPSRQSAIAAVSPVAPAENAPTTSSPNASASNVLPSGPSPVPAENQFVRPLSSSTARSSAEPTRNDGDANEPDELEAMAPPSSVPSSAGRRIPTTITEQVTESRAKKPGSGHRRRISAVKMSQPSPPGVRASSSSTPEAPPLSSPSARRPRPGDKATRPTRPSGVARPPTVPVREATTQIVVPVNKTAPPPRQPPSLEDVTEESEAEASDEEAVEVPAREAATTIGRKRPRANTTPSVELGPSDEDEDDDEDDTELGSASQISSYTQNRKSPASQRHPARHSQQHSQQSRSKKKRHSSSSEQNEDDETVDITVQRFVNNLARDDDDEIQQEIPYANRAGETVVDIFAQVSEEVVARTLRQLRRAAAQTDDVSEKKECRIKIRAIEAYGEELSSRLLEHAIHLNHWHSLRRRLRHVQKEKLALRDEIIRLKGEREQVALRMDAIRIKHEAESAASMSRLNASALMHDIDLAVEQGREAPELSQAAERTADLGNLDIVLAQIADQVSSTSSTGGGLVQQVRDFNAFLERAANALESR